MSGNTAQLFSRVGDIQWVASGLGPNIAMDGSGTALVFTADSANGGRIERVSIIHLGSNAASLLRFFIGNGSTFSLIEEVVMPTNTLSQGAISTPQFLLRVPIILAPSYTLKVAVAAVVASGYQITAFGGKY